MILSIYASRDPEEHPLLEVESDGEGRYRIEGHGLPRQDGGAEYRTDDGLHVLGLVALVFNASDSAEYLRRRLRDHEVGADTPYPPGHPRYERLRSLILDPEHAYPEPMIDTRYLRRASGKATDEDLLSIARDEATIRAIKGES